jgi:hypothetical protein
LLERLLGLERANEREREKQCRFFHSFVSSVTSLPMVRDWGGWMEAAWQGRLVRGRTVALRLGLKLVSHSFPSYFQFLS